MTKKCPLQAHFILETGNLVQTHFILENSIAAWQAIWAMNESELNGKRRYIADFEIYDDRASDPNNTVVEIYIGIES